MHRPFFHFLPLIASSSLVLLPSSGEGNGPEQKIRQPADLSLVAPAGQNPQANGDSLGTFQDTALTVSTTRLLSNDTNPNGGTLVVTSVVPGMGPDSGSVMLNGGMITYTPKPGFLGTDLFTYSIADGLGGSSSGSVTVTMGTRSSFRITAITKNGSQINLAGTAVPGGYYVVQIADNVGGPFMDFTGSFQPAPDGTFNFVDLSQPLPGRRFYRLRVSG